MGSGLGAYVVLVVLVLSTVPASAAWSVGVAGGGRGQAASAAAPAVPSGVAAACTSATGQTIRVSWTAASRATSYAVYESVTGAAGVYTLLAAWPASPYTTGTLTPAVTYYFEVEAVSGSSWASALSSPTAGHSIGLGSCR